ncbi:MAG: hypothetical protein A2V70_13280 [Planctomycetes bacterium RBG_13_63_9]|nr:MAG: hypothetical protein A2V70_13280 [Planctomycetes bacterium RBG_13_63_9]
MRIGSRFSGIDLIAQHNLLAVLDSLSVSSARLATMQRITRGSDDPAGLIAMEDLRAELTAIKEASDNAARAGGVVHVADAALGEVSSLLNTVRGNVVAAAGGGLSDAEIEALQLETDAALEAINRIGRMTFYGDQKLLDGSAEDGLSFAFSPEVATTSTLELPEISTTALGGSSGALSDLASGGARSLVSGNLEEAMEIVDSAGSQVLAARAEAGAFEKYTVDSAARMLGEMEVQISSALSQVADTDAAEESSRFIRAQTLARVATTSVMLAGQNRSLIGHLLDGL